MNWDGRTLALYDEDLEQAEADLKFLAAAPDLLKALQECEHELDTWHNWQLAQNPSYPKSEGSDRTRGVLIRALAAIARATGKEVITPS